MEVHLIDGTYELFRHYYAVPRARDADGREVGAVRGVLASVLAMINGGATHVGVATDHIIESTSKLFPLDEWVAVEVEVHGNEEVIHRVNGVEVLRYQHPQLDPSDDSAKALLAAGAPLQLSFGHIALQAESQPVWFRNIKIRPLPR